MIIPISNNILDNFQLINQEYLVKREYYELKSGDQEYRLYSFLSTYFNNITILDIGTYDGRSAIALSHNETNKVISYDIVDNIQNKNHIIYTKKNITLNIRPPFISFRHVLPTNISKSRLILFVLLSKTNKKCRFEMFIGLNKSYKTGIKGARFV